MVTISVDAARSVSERVLLNLDVSAEHAAIQVDLLLEAELRGRASHGLMRLPTIAKRLQNGVAKPGVTGTHRWVANGFLAVDGEHGLGPIVAMAAITEAVKRVPEQGIVIAAISKCNHLGMLSWYAEKITSHGIAAIILSTSEALVHPWGGKKAMIGTNPIAIGLPAFGTPFVSDLATSAISMGEIHSYASRGILLPPGLAIDRNGDATQNAAEAKEGAIAPFGGPKGYALGLAIELLVAMISRTSVGRDISGTLDTTLPATKGDIFILIDGRAEENLLSTIARYLSDVRASGQGTGVLIPGDRALATRQKNLQDGLDLPDRIWNEISAFSLPAEVDPSNALVGYDATAAADCKIIAGG